ncbi:hypothetical protein BDW22DRAFT_902287 [Trametopsis cervina]|nr:hypothetical protein BDW22DRAFT_902287 [Trametopsis cervina]
MFLLPLYLSPTETPLTQSQQPMQSVAPNDSEAYFVQKSALPLVNPFGYTSTLAVNRSPYWEEPFLYSIPRLPARSPLQHARTQSALVRGSTSEYANRLTMACLEDSFPATLPLGSLSSTEAHSLPFSDTSYSDHQRDVLTGAFQKSFTTASSRLSSVSSARVHFEPPPSPPASFRDRKLLGRSLRISSNKKGGAKTNGIPVTLGASAAEPVLSFAQAELKQSPSSGTIARVVRVSKGNSRPRSPYPTVRGRRNSVLKVRSTKLSDEDLDATLENGDLHEKMGFGRLLPTVLFKRGAADENQPIEEMPERGRARSRTRAGRRR